MAHRDMEYLADRDLLGNQMPEEPLPTDAEYAAMMLKLAVEDAREAVIDPADGAPVYEPTLDELLAPIKRERI